MSDTHVRELLREAAADPGPDLDAGAVLLAAKRRTRRRTAAAGFAAVAAVIVVAAPVVSLPEVPTLSGIAGSPEEGELGRLPDGRSLLAQTPAQQDGPRLVGYVRDGRNCWEVLAPVSPRTACAPAGESLVRTSEPLNAVSSGPAFNADGVADTTRRVYGYAPGGTAKVHIIGGRTYEARAYQAGDEHGSRSYFLAEVGDDTGTLTVEALDDQGAVLARTQVMALPCSWIGADGQPIQRPAPECP